MSRLTKTVGAASVLLATTGVAALTAGSQGNEGERAVSEDRLSASARIAEAFRAASAVVVEEGLVEKVRRAARKADRLPVGAACDGPIWPTIATGCLAGTGTPAKQSVRKVTVEHRAGDDTSVLVRMPVQQAASER